MRYWSVVCLFFFVFVFEFFVVTLQVFRNVTSPTSLGYNPFGIRVMLASCVGKYLHFFNFLEVLVGIYIISFLNILYNLPVKPSRPGILFILGDF